MKQALCLAESNAFENDVVESPTLQLDADAFDDPRCRGSHKETRAGFVALIGLPNAGKSTLLNAFLGDRLAITSPKAQTTRFPIRGVGVYEKTQIIVVDTPGLLQKTKTTLDRAMLRAAVGALEGIDQILLVVDAKAADPWEKLVHACPTLKDKTFWVVFNKVDKISKPRLLEWASLYQERAEKIFMVSALYKEGTQDIWRALAASMPKGAWLFDEATSATMPRQLWAAEIVREVMLRDLQEEVPHQLYVEPERFEDKGASGLIIGQVVHVETKAHKKIVLGKNGDRIKEMSVKARKALRERLKRPVHLYLYVRVSENWMNKPAFYRMVGLSHDA